MCENCVKLNHEEAPGGLVEEKYILLSDLTFLHIPDTLQESSDISIFLNVGIFDIYRILGECLLISSWPGKALRTFVDIARLAERINMRSQSLAWST